MGYVIPADVVMTNVGPLPRNMLAPMCSKCGTRQVGYFKGSGNSELLDFSTSEKGYCVWLGPHAMTCPGSPA